MKPTFSHLSSFWVRLRAIFRWHVTLFSPELQFFLAPSCTSPRFGHFFERSHPLFSPHSLFTQRECFSDSAFPFCILCSTFLFPLISFPPLSHPALHLLPPLSLTFLPTFLSPSPINARSRAPPRTTRVRVRLHIRTRQEVFVYCLHRFTHLPQYAVHQHIRCEEKQEKTFTKYTTISKSTSYHKHPISSTVNSICHCGEPIYHHREHKSKKPSPLTRCATTICGIQVKR